MTVFLSNRGNPDFRQDHRHQIPGTPRDQWVEVADLDEASRVCRAYIVEHDLGSGNWTGGEVRSDLNEVVARISFNGRVWTGDQQ